MQAGIGFRGVTHEAVQWIFPFNVSLIDFSMCFEIIPQKGGMNAAKKRNTQTKKHRYHKQIWPCWSFTGKHQLAVIFLKQ